MNLSNFRKLVRLARTQVILRYAERFAGSTSRLLLDVDIDGFVVDDDILHLYRVRKWRSLGHPDDLVSGQIHRHTTSIKGPLEDTLVPHLFGNEPLYNNRAWDSAKPFCGTRQPFDQEFSAPDMGLVPLIHLSRFYGALEQISASSTMTRRLGRLITERLEDITAAFNR